ncbi:hypothetical protein QTP86_010596 [Hemibagrus guttatus]|nr:hypothetical protein QTP86_010596 [Hemibagrus guttatus]
MLLPLLKISVKHSHIHRLSKVHYHLSFKVPFLNSKLAHHLLITCVPLTNMSIKIRSYHHSLTGVSCGAELSFTLEPSDIIAVQEQPLMLHCQVEGIPPITTQWRRNGVILLEDKNYTTFINGSLLIGRFQRRRSDGSSDEGDYECVAQNSFGLVVSRKAKVQAARWIVVKGLGCGW